MRRGVNVVVWISMLLLGAGLVVGLLGRIRTEADKMACRRNLSQIGLALHNYHDYQGSFPAATLRNPDLPPERRLSWLFELGPFLQSIMDSNWNKHQHEPWDSEGNLEYKRYFIRLHECPRASEAELPFDAAPTSYVAATGLGTDAALLPKSESRAGVFGYDRQTSMREISDGLSDTIMVIETDFQVGPWLAGGPPTARGLDSEALSYLGRGRPFGGLHRGGTMAVFADGTVHFIRDTIDREALEALFTIARGDQPGSVAD